MTRLDYNRPRRHPNRDALADRRATSALLPATDRQMLALDVLGLRLGLPVPIAMNRAQASSLIRSWRDRADALPAD
jgi:hypothetical protein